MAKWQIDSTHTTAHFVVKHMMVTNVRGSFDKITGTIEYDPANLAASSVDVQIEAASITTGVEQRDAHLKSPDFFNVEKYPYITFKSTKFTPSGDSEGTLTGDLTIAGVTHSVDIKVEFQGQGKNPWGVVVAGFTGETKINREDFGLTWNQALETGGVLVGRDIKIALDVEAALVTETATASV